ncbi:MAG: hypothetical protein NXI00_10840 [Cytophagales bacterium]|nr:hypothetical protein [Cytophagales bacterium]
MTKIQLEISDAAHEGLLEEQFKRKKRKEKKTSLADIAADFIEEMAKQKAAHK